MIFEKDDLKKVLLSMAHQGVDDTSMVLIDEIFSITDDRSGSRTNLEIQFHHEGHEEKESQTGKCFLTCHLGGLRKAKYLVKNFKPS
jgi:hypothetical protein